LSTYLEQDPPRALEAHFTWQKILPCDLIARKKFFTLSRTPAPLVPTP